MNKKLIIAAIFALVATIAGLRHPSSDTTPGHDNGDISTLTQQQRVADYLRQHQRLPSYYLTKDEARRQGWQPASGNLCDILPGRAIGGDRFSNREGRLPQQQDRRWFEADVNYRCGRRGSDRLIWSSDGMIYLTRDHYRHFEQVK